MKAYFLQGLLLSATAFFFGFIAYLVGHLDAPPALRQAIQAFFIGNAVVGVIWVYIIQRASDDIIDFEAAKAEVEKLKAQLEDDIAYLKALQADYAAGTDAATASEIRFEEQRQQLESALKKVDGEA